MCFSALDDRYGAFTIKEDGFIDTFKLVHRRGRGIKCNRNFPAAYWGCLNRNNEPDILTTVITFSNNTALPIANYSETISNTGALCRYYAYRISGVDVNSKELTFEGLHSPLWVKIGEDMDMDTILWIAMKKTTAVTHVLMHTLGISSNPSKT